jgi:copper homeostasis protein (lipoprotein)
MTTRNAMLPAMVIPMLMAGGCAGTGSGGSDTEPAARITGTVANLERTALAPDAEPFAPLPATYVGVLPCADCPGIRYHLDLLPDNVFHLRMTYLERPAAGDLDDIGSWALSSDGGTLILGGGHEGQEMFAVKGPQTLRKLDVDGGEIPSSLPYDLERAAAFAAFEPRLAMSGMYSYLADAAVFTECLTGARYPVAMEADYVALERAYTQAPHEPGAAVRVTLEGRLAQRPRMEGTGTQTTLVVDRFIGIRPGETCPPRFTAAPLANTTWTLTSLGDQPVVAADPQRRAYLVLDEAAHRLAGSGGCNRLLGGFEREGDRLRFSQVASTMMACPDGMDTEAAFTKALSHVATWRVLGRTLEFYDSEGRRVARFQADATP